MAKRLYMTTADYVTIALSPALVMTLVGSLVFFLIEVLYVGEYGARLMYVFALFVFAAVLIARISIENGSEYASFFALPLGLATFFVLQRFVEHPSPFSWLINIGLMSVVWWCAHKLTWDCTLIDDDEDSSGEGLMQRIGVDEGESTDNELLADQADPAPWWRRLFIPKKGKHTPGLWVLYFSLAALPLFGVGQYWVPAADVGRRRYVFSLLLVYVASALALLVTTSFLGLRRYLRQRRVEMPAPMAANWVGIGAVLIVVVMLLAALIPRPYAEYAISQVPWQATSPGGLSSSRFAAGRDGSAEFDRSGNAIKQDAPQGDAVRENGTGEPAESDQGKPEGTPGGDSKTDGKPQGDKAEDGSQTDSDQQGQHGEQTPGDSGERKNSDGGKEASGGPEDRKENETAEGGQAANAPLPQHAADEKPFELPKISPPPLGMLAGAAQADFLRRAGDSSRRVHLEKPASARPRDPRTARAAARTFGPDCSAAAPLPKRPRQAPPSPRFATARSPSSATPFPRATTAACRRKNWSATRSRPSKPGPATPATPAPPTRRPPNWSARPSSRRHRSTNKPAA